MSREILFKAKRKNWRELPKDEWWVEGSYHNQIYYYGNPCDDHYIIDRTENGYGEYWEIDPETLCQYTNKEDKNHNKIFDRHIIRNEKGEIGVVQWFEEHAAFMIWHVKENKIYYLGDNNSLKVKVIGNIFDNPELLGGAE
ncbi:YopX family protein [Sellimonas intestinalis]|uniref:YopX family protein n=1 Tax=Sellimonas intestinalis TaxID=1653434 RepID=UPI003AB46B8E